MYSRTRGSSQQDASASPTLGWLDITLSTLNKLPTFCPLYLSIFSRWLLGSREFSSTKSPHTMDIFTRVCGLMGNYWVTCGDEVGTIWRESAAGQFVGCLYIGYWQDVGSMLILPQHIAHIFTVLPKLTSTGYSAINVWCASRMRRDRRRSPRCSSH